MVLEHGAHQYLIEVEAESQHRSIKVSVGGKIVRKVAVGEVDSDARILDILKEIETEEVARRTIREYFRYGQEEFIIEVWPVYRGFKTMVLLGEQIVSGPVSWNGVGVFSSAAELLDVMKDEIRSGSIQPLRQKDYFPL